MVLPHKNYHPSQKKTKKKTTNGRIIYTLPYQRFSDLSLNLDLDLWLNLQEYPWFLG